MAGEIEFTQKKFKVLKNTFFQTEWYGMATFQLGAKEKGKVKTLRADLTSERLASMVKSLKAAVKKKAGVLMGERKVAFDPKQTKKLLRAAESCLAALKGAKYKMVEIKREEK